MHRSLTVWACAGALALSCAAVGVASADTTTTGPDSAACATATATVLLRSETVVQEGDKLDAAKAALIDAAKDKVDAAQKLRDQALNALPAKDAPNYDTALALLKSREKALSDALADLTTASAGLADTAAGAKAKSDLEDAVKARTAACTAPAPDPTPTPTPAPAPKDCGDFASQADAQAALEKDPTLQPTLDPDKDGQACHATVTITEQVKQVPVVPSGGVQTGA